MIKRIILAIRKYFAKKKVYGIYDNPDNPPIFLPGGAIGFKKPAGITSGWMNKADWPDKSNWANVDGGPK